MGKHHHTYMGSHKYADYLENMSRNALEWVSSRVDIVYGSSTLEEYRKLKPLNARHLETGTATIRECRKCGVIFVAQRHKGVKICWPCYSKTKGTFSKELQDIIDKLYQEKMGKQGVTVKNI